MTAEAREQILGIQFFRGTPADAVECSKGGGLVVAPSGTCFERFLRDAEYRRAILNADLVLPDSGLMVSLWRILRGGKIQRISGLAYLKRLLAQPAIRGEDEAFWILPNEKSRDKLLAWLNENGFSTEADNCYVAPIYGSAPSDRALLEKIGMWRPQQIVIAIGAGAQEKLGWFLRERLGYRPAIHCIGGALGFITGDQVAIPDWADRFFLGWFFRLLTQPRVFIPRLWKARVLPGLIIRHGRNLPP